MSDITPVSSRLELWAEIERLRAALVCARVVLMNIRNERIYMPHSLIQAVMAQVNDVLGLAPEPEDEGEK